MTGISLRRGGAILLCFTALTALGVASAGAKPKPVFVPKVGSYEGTSTAGSDRVKAGGEVTKKGSKYTVTFGLQMPTTCESAIGPQSDLLAAEINAPVKGKAFSLKGPVENRNGAFGAATINVNVTGRFTSASAFTATGTIEVPAGVSCTSVPVTVKEKLIS